MIMFRYWKWHTVAFNNETKNVLATYGANIFYTHAVNTPHIFQHESKHHEPYLIDTSSETLSTQQVYIKQLLVVYTQNDHFQVRIMTKFSDFTTLLPNTPISWNL